MIGALAATPASGLGDHQLVPHRGGRDPGTGQLADLAHPGAGRVHDHRGVDAPGGGFQPG